MKRSVRKKRRSRGKGAQAGPEPRSAEVLAPAAPSGARLWGFRLVSATVVPLLLLLVAELSLRIAGHGYPVAAAVSCRSDGREAFCSNLSFTRRFFPERLAPWLGPFVFPAEKTDESYRILVLGASAAQGDPKPLFGFWRFLEVLLQERYPGVRFEMINATTVAINSHVTLQIAKDLAAHRPDLLVVYLGNNEVVGPYGAGSVVTPFRADLRAIRAGVWARSLRLGQLLDSLWTSLASREGAPGDWRGMEMFLGHQVRWGSPELERVYGHFERNLRDICKSGRDVGAEVVLSTVASNLRDNAPFASSNRLDLSAADRSRWNRFYREGAEHQAAARHGAAVQSYLEAAKIDDTFAELQFRLGESFWAMGSFPEARRRYVLARDLDTLRFRADTRINQIIASVAQEGAPRGVHLVDAVATMDRSSPHGIPGRELFWEHVHFRLPGNYLLARAFLDRIEMLTEEQCAQRLAYTGWSHHALTRRILEGYVTHAPFTHRLGNAGQVELLEEERRSFAQYTEPEGVEIALAALREAVERRPADWAARELYAELLHAGLNDPSAAEEQLRLVVRSVPHNVAAATRLANVMREDGAFDEAIALLRGLLAMGARTETVHRDLGRSLAARGDLGEAAEQYSRALEINPRFLPPYLDLAEVLRRQGEVERAVGVLRNGIEIHPDQAALHLHLAGCLFEQGRRPAAIDELHRALQIDPGLEEAREALRKLEGQGPG